MDRYIARVKPNVHKQLLLEKPSLPSKVLKIFQYNEYGISTFLLVGQNGILFS